jgi:ankyrin repeat protein
MRITGENRINRKILNKFLRAYGFDAIAAGADVNMADKDGWTALHIAAYNGHVEIVPQLLAAGADVNKANRYGRKALHGAGEEVEGFDFGDLSFLDEIDKSKVNTSTLDIDSFNFDDLDFEGLGADVNKAVTSSVFSGSTALYLAAYKGHVEIVAQLLAYGADEKLLTESQQRRHAGIIAEGRAILLNEFLREYGFDAIAAGADVNKTNKNGSTALYCAASLDRVEIVAQLLKAGADVNKARADGWTALYLAAIHGHVEIVAQLLAAGADVNQANSKGETALYLAAIHGHVEIVAQLLAAGADVNQANSKGETALYIAAKYDYLDVVQQLLAAGADVNKVCTSGSYPGSTALYIAAIEGNIKTVEQLLEVKGIDVNKAHNDGSTVLQIVASHGHVEIVAQLLKAGADVNKANSKGETALYWAAEQGHTAIVKLLEKYKAFEASISSGNTKQIREAILRGHNISNSDICFAIEKGRSEIALYFIEQVQQESILKGAFKVPLVEAAIKGNNKVVEALLEKGADPNLQDGNQRSAFDIAKIKCDRKLEKLLSKDRGVTNSSTYSLAAEVRPSAPPYEMPLSYKDRAQTRVPEATAVFESEEQVVTAKIVDESPQSYHVARLKREKGEHKIEGCCAIS